MSRLPRETVTARRRGCSLARYAALPAHWLPLQVPGGEDSLVERGWQRSCGSVGKWGVEGLAGEEAPAGGWRDASGEDGLAGGIG